tara:strand:+ start:18459 stop:19832 length:1374 start_codon:yes stop_codon:yes gene_type:complete
MITRQSVTSIYSLAQVAEQNGLIILPQATTPLAVLGDALGEFTLGESVEESVIGASERKDVAGEKAYAVAIDEMVDIAAGAVQRQLKFAREIVRPVVTDAFEKVTAHLDQVPVSTLRNSIVEVQLPEVYLESGLSDMVDRFKTQPQLELTPLGNIMPELSAEDLIERCKTGMSRIDEKLKSMIEASPGIVSRVYDEYFLGKLSQDAVEGSRYSEIVVAFVLARNLNMNVPEGVNEELAFYRERTAFFIAEFGRRVFQALRRQERIERQNDIIDYMPPADFAGAEIRVNASVYRRYLKEGGTPEAIIGACLRGISRPVYADLLEDAYGGAKAVQVNERAIQNRIKAEYEANVHAAVIDVVSTLIAEDNFPEDLDRPTTRGAREWLTANPFRKKFDLDNYVLRAVCGIIFPRYNAYPVLSGIMEYMAADETLTNREAATMVTIDLVGEWLADQLITEQA